MRMSAAEVAHAVAEALRAGDDEDGRWELVSRLHLHGGRPALDAAARLARDAEPAHRELAADVLGQLGAAEGRSPADGPFQDAAQPLLLDMLRTEEDPGVLQSIAVGLGHIGDERCVAPLARLRAHPAAQVREGVVFGMLGRPEPAALATLISLSADPEPWVRDWATFGLARQTDQDFPQLREALAARLADDDPDTRAEAIHGLAVRGDPRAVRPLLQVLQGARDGDIDFILIEALHALADATVDPRLRPHLLADVDRWPPDEIPTLLRSALARYGR